MEIADHISCHPLSVADYHRLGEVGILEDGDRIELIEGVLVDMAPIGSEHASLVNRISHCLAGSLSSRVIISTQNPVTLDDRSEPQPDIAVLRYRDDFYATAHPTPMDVLLVVEVADTSLDYDQRLKIPLYARHGVAEVWLAAIGQRSIEVFRHPNDQGYRERMERTEQDSIRPTLLPDTLFRVADLLGH